MGARGRRRLLPLARPAGPGGAGVAARRGAARGSGLSRLDARSVRLRLRDVRRALPHPRARSRDGTAQPRCGAGGGGRDLARRREHRRAPGRALGRRHPLERRRPGRRDRRRNGRDARGRQRRRPRAVAVAQGRPVPPARRRPELPDRRRPHPRGYRAPRPVSASGVGRGHAAVRTPRGHVE